MSKSINKQENNFNGNVGNDVVCRDKIINKYQINLKIESPSNKQEDLPPEEPKKKYKFTRADVEIYACAIGILLIMLWVGYVAANNLPFSQLDAYFFIGIFILCCFQMCRSVAHIIYDEFLKNK